MSTVIVVPAYNEATRLDVEAFAEHARRATGIDILFVDDASTDATRDILRDLCARFPTTLQWSALPENRGKAEAVRHGLTAALTAGATTVGYLDADLATPLAALPELLAALAASSEIMLVMGARVKLLGRRIVRKPHRHYLGRVFATFTSLALDLAVYDTQCGAKVMRASPALVNALSRPFGSRWIFDVELLARLGSELGPLDDKVVEVPLASWEDVAGSKLALKDFARAAIELLIIWWRYPKPS